MAINIKELFTSDLNPNGTTWWSNDKISKINYNFSQMTSGGMVGPSGMLGFDGISGPIGSRGSQGFMGNRGFQGFQGSSASDVWISRKNQSGVLNLVPNFNIGNVTRVSPPVIKIGFKFESDDNSQFNSADSSKGYVVIGNIASSDPNKINLRLQSDTKVSDFKLTHHTHAGTTSISLHIGKMVSSDLGFSLKQVASRIILKSKPSNTNPTSQLNHEISEHTIVIGNNTVSDTSMTLLSRFPDKFTEAKGEFQYNNDAHIGDILVSADNEGSLVWKDKKSIFGSFPIGSIMSIREDEFNSTNFHLNESISQSGNPLPMLRNRYGRGKLSTDYAGWYLCNGLSWEIQSGVNSQLTPNLNSFVYDISPNGGEQNHIIGGGNNAQTIIGGYDISVRATESNGTYNVIFDNDFHDNNSTLHGDVPIEFTENAENLLANNTQVTRMIHIVYLENDSLTWSKSNIDPPLPVIDNISLGYRSTNTASNEICQVSTSSNYSWNGITGTWGSFDELIIGTYLYMGGTTNVAPSGFYIDLSSGKWRFWNSNNLTFTQVSTCPNIQTGNILLAYSDRVDGINGEASLLNSSNYLIDTSSFITATFIRVNQSSNASAGWYRTIDTGRRRYWNGNQFEGRAFKRDFIISIKSSTGLITRFDNITNAVDACNNYNNAIQVESFIEHNYDIDISIGELIANQFVIFVPINYVFLGNATPGLVSVIDQNSPDNESPFKRIYLKETDQTVTNTVRTAIILSSTGWIGNEHTCN